MKSEIQTSKVTQLRPHLHGAAYQSFVRSIPIEQSRALNIEVDFHHFENADDEFMELLIAEIKLWAKFLGKRQLHSVTLNDCLPKTAPFELTRLMHVLASHFHISEQDKLFMVIAPLDQLSNECLALLKGLGFNELRLVVGPKDLSDLENVRQQIENMRLFGFKRLGLHVRHTDCSDELCHQIKSIKNTCSPDSVSLGNIRTNSVIPIVLDEFPPSKLRAMDYLHLGPDAVSQIGSLRIRNFCSKSRYEEALGAGRLPILIG